MKKFKVLGLMSGTSLDGLDLALCTFDIIDDIWSFSIERAETIKYSKQLLAKLIEAPKMRAEQFALLDSDLGKFFAKTVVKFLGNENIDLIASHGHTIFQQPEINFTKQIGAGAAIYAATGIPTACDFRAVDVFLGGQGAPLVPLGDQILFSEHDYCINLGGIANISYVEGDTMKAYDICPVNQVFNYVAEKFNKEYDDSGEIAKKGVLNIGLFQRLNDKPFYAIPPPKSLGREWVEEEVLNEINNYSLEDFQRTFAEHVAYQIVTSIKGDGKSILLTGGGAYNDFLISLLKQKLVGHKVIVPQPAIIDFKEALIFAFLGIQGALGNITSLSSVTGASRDSLSMAMYGTFKR